MSNIGELVSRLVAQGIDVEEASEIVALAVAAGAATSAYRKSAGAVRQKRYRESLKGVTKRNESVTPLRSDERNESVTNRNESVTRDAASLSKSNKIERKRERGTQLSDGWRPSDTAWRSAVDRVGEQRAEIELVKFRNHAADKGRVSKNWDAAFRNWIDRAIEYGGLPPPPSTATTDFVPDWDAQVARFLKGHPWSAKWYGPEPGQIGCRVPAEILVKHGVLSEDRKIFAA
jgi:hypothetical protein